MIEKIVQGVKGPDGLMCNPLLGTQSEKMFYFQNLVLTIMQEGAGEFSNQIYLKEDDKKKKEEEEKKQEQENLGF